VTDVYPVILEPKVLDKPWGRKGMGPQLVPGADPDLTVGEAWLTADNGGQSIVTNGALQGASLKDLRTTWGPALVGQCIGGRAFPLLLKLLYANEYLSVQVHPDDDAASRLENAPNGKTEAWYILKAEPGAELVMGLKPGLGKEDLENALNEGRVEEIIRRVPARAGEVHYLHAGRLHAIGPGVTLFEIQQNSDITYRFYDWGRLDNQGNPRELHREKAIQVVDLHEPNEQTPFTGLAIQQDSLNITFLAAGQHFALQKWETSKPFTNVLNGGRFQILVTLSGNGLIISQTSEPRVELAPGRAVILPAALGDWQLKPSCPVTVLRAFVPDLAEDVVAPLKKAGFHPDQIALLSGPGRSNDLKPLLP
jgi:mannose-6-phosphate isomerase